MITTIKHIETGSTTYSKARKTYEWKCFARVLSFSVAEIYEVN